MNPHTHTTRTARLAAAVILGALALSGCGAHNPFQSTALVDTPSAAADLAYGDHPLQAFPGIITRRDNPDYHPREYLVVSTSGLDSTAIAGLKVTATARDEQAVVTSNAAVRLDWGTAWYVPLHCSTDPACVDAVSGSNSLMVTDSQELSATFSAPGLVGAEVRCSRVTVEGDGFRVTTNTSPIVRHNDTVSVSCS